MPSAPHAWPGCGDLGENYAAELLTKAAAAGEGPAPRAGPCAADVVWHFLGAVQRNKVAKLAPVVGLWQSVAREAEGARIARVRSGCCGPGPGGHDGAERSQRVHAGRDGNARWLVCAPSGSMSAG